MGSQKEVNIEPIKGTLNDYVIKDKDKIVVGRFRLYFGVNTFRKSYGKWSYCR